MIEQRSGEDRDTREFLTELTAHLLRRGVDGHRVGEVLAEVEAHVAATGEPAREAFGDPDDYARRWVRPQPPGARRRRRVRLVAALLAAAAAGAVLAVAALAAGRGDAVLGLPGWVLTVLAVLALVGAVAAAPVVRVVDPRTGRPRPVGRTALLLGAAVPLVVVVALLVLVGSLTGG